MAGLISHFIISLADFRKIFGQKLGKSVAISDFGTNIPDFIKSVSKTERIGLNK